MDRGAGPLVVQVALQHRGEGLAESLYGGASRVVLVGVGAGSLDAADHLSDVLERALPDVVEVVVDVVSGRPIFDIGP